ncbi:hypothetical protein [Paenibacillus sp. FSL K6-1230]|uniref:hypothetical protein n=1 Tax=Paenibacillus sp. FSL K6-1230 TaxID=2921603 RepID=UPI0030FCD20D
MSSMKLEPNIQFRYEEGGDSYFDFDFRLNIEATDIFSQIIASELSTCRTILDVRK